MNTIQEILADAQARWAAMNPYDEGDHRLWAAQAAVEAAGVSRANRAFAARQVLAAWDRQDAEKAAANQPTPEQVVAKAAEAEKAAEAKAKADREKAEKTAAAKIRDAARTEVINLARELYPDDCPCWSRADLDGVNSGNVMQRCPTAKAFFLGGQSSHTVRESDGDGGYVSYDLGDVSYGGWSLRPDWEALDAADMCRLRDSLRVEKLARRREFESGYARKEWRWTKPHESFLPETNAFILRAQAAWKKARKMRREREEREKQAAREAREAARQAAGISRPLPTEQAEDKLAQTQREAKNFNASSWGALDGIKL